MSDGMTGTREKVSNYYNVNLGRIVKSLGTIEPEDMTSITERLNKDGVKVYEILADYIGGRIIAAELKAPQQGKEDYGHQMVFTLQNAAGAKSVLNCKFDSAYGRGFMFSLPNADLTQEIEFEPYQYFSKKKGKDISGLSLLQFGSQLDWAYGTRENTGGMPQLKEVVFKGKNTWDNTEQLAFLTEKFKAFVEEVKEANAPEDNDPEEAAPTRKAANAPETKKAPKAKAKAEEAQEDGDDDPF